MNYLIAGDTAEQKKKGCLHADYAQSDLRLKNNLLRSRVTFTLCPKNVFLRAVEVEQDDKICKEDEAESDINDAGSHFQLPARCFSTHCLAAMLDFESRVG